MQNFDKINIIEYNLILKPYLSFLLPSPFVYAYYTSQTWKMDLISLQEKVDLKFIY